MKDTDLKDLLKIAATLKEDEWHFHFLTPDCIFNDSHKYKLVLETKEGNYFSFTNERPIKELERLEQLFYRRNIN